MIPFIDLKTQALHINNDIKNAIERVLSHGKFILGPEVVELEERLSTYTGANYCISVANGTDAIQIALMALGIGRGDEVITPAFSYISTAEAVKLLGAKPVYADIDPESYNIDPMGIEKLITKKTKAIIPVSLYGLPANFEAINLLANEKGIPVIEDAAQSFGGTYGKKKSCNLSTVACTSFFPTKPLGCYGDGGAIFTSDKELAKIIRQIARHGQEKRYHHIRLGVNSRLDTIQAAILLVKLKILDLEITKRKVIAKKYNDAFCKSDQIGVPLIPEENTSAWAQYTIRVSNRSEVQTYLEKAGIPSVVHYPIALSLQPAVSEPALVPESRRASKEVLSLPVFGDLRFEDQQSIIDAVLTSVA